MRFAMQQHRAQQGWPASSSGANFVPNVVSFATGTARITWPANYDRDNANLTYEVIRNGDTTTPVYTTTDMSNFCTRPTMNFVDTGLTPGATYTYRDHG